MSTTSPQPWGSRKPVDCPDEPPTDLQPVEFFTAKYPGFTVPFVREQIKNRRVCAYKIGGRWFIGEADFTAFITAGRNVQ